MFKKLGKGRLALAFAMVAVFCLGFAAPVLAEEEATYGPDDAKLTKVVVAPVGTDASGDSYVFHFAGAGTVAEDGDNMVSDGVVQDNTTLKKDDIVPTIPDVTLKGVELTADNALSNGQVGQVVVQKSITQILQNVVFPHAGVYTYVVTEKSVSLSSANGY